MFRALMPAGGECRASGLQITQLEPGTTGAAQIIVKSGRKNVTLPTMPLGLPVRVQLQTSTGECWEATYSSATYNSAISFQAQAD